jgi:LuxR family maltose regulon positive regulatory protein
MDYEKIALIEEEISGGHGGPDRLPAPAFNVDAHLSPREVDVLDQLAKGLSNKQIARALVITPHTVKAHMTRILYKLNVSSRTEAAVIWATKGKPGR